MPEQAALGVGAAAMLSTDLGFFGRPLGGSNHVPAEEALFRWLMLPILADSPASRLLLPLLDLARFAPRRGDGVANRPRPTVSHPPSQVTSP
jgi:hypothetical protein